MTTWGGAEDILPRLSRLREEMEDAEDTAWRSSSVARAPSRMDVSDRRGSR